MKTETSLDKELESWLKMADSIAHVITASSSLLQLMHRNSFAVSNEIHLSPTSSEACDRTMIGLQPDFLPYGDSPLSSIEDKFKQCTSRPTAEYLDEQYRRAKQAIFRRYGPQNRLTTLYTRENANIDFIDDNFIEGLYKISVNASERELDNDTIEKLQELFPINKHSSAEEIYIHALLNVQ